MFDNICVNKEDSEEIEYVCEDVHTIYKKEINQRAQKTEICLSIKRGICTLSRVDTR